MTLFRNTLQNKHSLSLSCQLLLMLIVGLNNVHADEYHYNNILIGDRAAGMAGAYVGIADDPAGLYYNPVGIVYAIGSNISGSMNSFHNITTTYKDALGGQLDWKRESSVLAPNYFGVFQPFAGGKVGFSYAVTDSIFENQDQEFANVTSTLDNPITNYVVNFNNQDTTYNIGPSFSIKFYDNLSAGITLYFHNRTQEIITNQLINVGTPTDDYEWSNSYIYNEEYGIRPIFGMMWAPIEKVSIGVTVSKLNVFNSEHTIQSTCKSAVVVDPASGGTTPSCTTDPILRTVQSNNHDRDHPLKISHGIAYFHSNRLLISSDVTYHSSTDVRSSTLNLSIGSEYYFNDKWAIRGGFYTNVANTPDLKTTNVTATQAPHVDLHGISLSLSHFARNSVLSVGFDTMFGSGKAQLFPAVSGTAQLQDVDISTLTMFMSATYSY